MAGEPGINLFSGLVSGSYGGRSLVSYYHLSFTSFLRWILYLGMYKCSYLQVYAYASNGEQ